MGSVGEEEQPLSCEEDSFDHSRGTRLDEPLTPGLASISRRIGNRLVESTGLSGTDRLLGGAFGAVRGLALVLLLLLVAGLTPLPADAWWQESRTIARMMPLVDWGASYLPDAITEHLEFEPGADEPENDAGDGEEDGTEQAATDA